MIKADHKVGKVALTSVLGRHPHCPDQTIHVIWSLLCMSSLPPSSEGLNVQCCVASTKHKAFGKLISCC